LCAASVGQEDDGFQLIDWGLYMQLVRVASFDRRQRLWPVHGRCRIRCAAVIVTVLATVLVSAGRAAATAPSSVTLAGELQSELGCGGDWDPACSATHLTFHASSGVWKGTWTLAAGNYQYKIALNDSWDENYGLHSQPGGANIPLSLGSSTAVTFYYDPLSHWATDSVSSAIVTGAGSFQHLLGCPGDWDPSCLRSWLEDPDGDGIYTLESYLQVGQYEAKAALNESWDVNYGLGGVVNGPNISFVVSSATTPVLFSYDASSHVLTISGGVVNDNSPTANAGPDQTVAPGASVSLDGTGSSDPDGDGLSYAWTQTAGPSVTLSSDSTAGPSFTAPTGPAKLNFNLQVCDTHSACDTDSVTVNVNAPRYAILGFFSPVPSTKWKSGQTVPIKIALTRSGVRISDAEAAGLLSSTCSVKFSATGAQAVAPTCMKYDVLNDQFVYNWKLGKSPGLETITATVSSGGVTSKSESITIVK
jgi:hypothetical protein